VVYEVNPSSEKNASVLVVEIRGICPQHFSMIAIFVLDFTSK
jgi:hypothetical protein